MQSAKEKHTYINSIKNQIASHALEGKYYPNIYFKTFFTLANNPEMLEEIINFNNEININLKDDIK